MLEDKIRKRLVPGMEMDAYLALLLPERAYAAMNVIGALRHYAFCVDEVGGQDYGVAVHAAWLSVREALAAWDELEDKHA